ncbi:GAF domain-containing protein [Catalinimonas alkaloidigena]|uniref:GAF domain-containing protein n=1 Tax=Catalinimonas alkaloidigena TaxID=1075417 RepID=A0A1G9RSN2_9BACT|nr:GAF domain-containing protein [Catalinimonas alkaloidigena]
MAAFGTSFLSAIIHGNDSLDLPPKLRRKIGPTNILAFLLITTVAIPFVGISLLYYPSLAWIPAAGGITCALVIMMNYWGGIAVSRYIISLLPFFLASSYNRILCGPGDEPITSVFLVEFSFALIPFVIFDLEEKVALAILCSITFLGIMTFPITSQWVTLEADTTVIRQGWVSVVANALGVLTGFGCLIGLASINKQAEKQVEQMLTLAEEKNTAMEEASESLRLNLEQLEAAKESERQRNWTSEGIAAVSETIRTHQNQKDIYDRLLMQIVQYMDVNQGALYIVEGSDEDLRLSMKGCYAYSRKKYRDYSCKPGEGLIGQIYLEREALVMTEIPPQYVKITSGVGAATPSSLAVIPLKVNESVEGILELASFRAFEEYEVEFLTKLGESIGSFVQSHRVSEHTRALLEETQLQAEMMRAQEEEMQQNMEELAATQEEYERKTRQYEKQIEDYKQEIRELQQLMATKV